jgi:hypothetical protein
MDLQHCATLQKNFLPRQFFASLRALSAKADHHPRPGSQCSMRYSASLTSNSYREDAKIAEAREGLP